MSASEDFQEAIGYSFKDKTLLKRALTHSSYANEKGFQPLSDNERLEFLGDAVLELITSKYLFFNELDRPEGELTRRRAALVCEPTLAQAAKKVGIGDYIYLSKGERASGGANRASILSDAMEAVIGALFLDGGMEAAEDYVHKFLLTDIEEKIMFSDSKTSLQEILQGKYKTAPRYEVIDERGPDHAKTFCVVVYANGKEIGRGEGSSKKNAQQEAARQGIINLNKNVS